MIQHVLARLRRTPGRLTVLLAGVLLLVLAAGSVGAWGLSDRAALVDRVTARSGPLAVAAQELYRSLSDADATVAAAFLAGGLEPVPVRQRYRQHIADASAALATVAGGGLDGTSAATAVADITAGIPVYTGLVETARAYHRQGLPLGAAYLREASGLMRDRLLPAAQEIYRSVTDRLDVARDAAARFPWFAVPLGLLAVAALILTQVMLARRTRRLINPGLAVATLAAVVSVVWLTAAWAASTGHLETSRRDGSVLVDLLVEARITALQARSDEALTLVARGTGGHFETSYVALMDQLLGEPGAPGWLDRAQEQARAPGTVTAIDEAVAEAQTWRAVHQTMRRLDSDGQYEDAVQVAVGAEPTSTASLVGRLDAALASGIADSSGVFDAEAQRAATALSRMDLAIAGLTLLVLAGATAGLRQRIREYS